MRTEDAMMTEVVMMRDAMMTGEQMTGAMTGAMIGAMTGAMRGAMSGAMRSMMIDTMTEGLTAGMEVPGAVAVCEYLTLPKLSAKKRAHVF